MDIDSTTDALVRTFGLTFTQPALLPPSSPLWNQFVIAQGVPVTVSVGATTWLIPPGAGLWIPAGQSCVFRNRGKMFLRMLYLPAVGHPDTSFDADMCSVLDCTPLLVELVRRVVLLGALVVRDPRHQRLSALIWDELSEAQILPTALTEPASEAAAQFLERLEAQSYRLDAIPDAIKAAGFSRRTLERSFLHETGISMGAWLRRRRALLAIERLLGGATVTDVAFELGYNGPSAFIEMFKRETGRLPREMRRLA